MSNPTAGQIQKTKRRVVEVEFLQFTGKNSKEFAKWISEQSTENLVISARAGGSYVTVTFDHPNGVDTHRIRKGYIGVSDKKGFVQVFPSIQAFSEFYVVPKNSVLI